MAKAKSGHKKVKRRNRQVNQYDKILRENIEAALPGLIRNLLHIHALNTEELPDDIQHTKERKPDIALSAIDYHLLLRSDKPEEKMLAILADLGSGAPKRIIENIVNQVIVASIGNFSKLRHVQQLRILSQLRNLVSDNLEIMDSVANNKYIKPLFGAFVCH
jgi:hypothetical protein